MGAATLTPGGALVLGPELLPRPVAGLASNHAQLALGPEGLWVTCLGAGPTFLGGHLLPVRQPWLAFPCDRVLAGELRVHIRLDPGEGQLPPRPPAAQELEQLRQLGEGGAGQVFLARQRASGRLLVVKVLRADVAAAPGARERFLREARVCFRLDSPYVVLVHDLRVEGQAVLLLMELADGGAASDLLRGGPLPLAQALAIAEHAALGLAAAHAVKIVHRDLKPENLLLSGPRAAWGRELQDASGVVERSSASAPANLLLSRSGPTRLGDFGLAKDLAATHGLTKTGHGLGSLAYVSPEQVMDSKRVDPRADLYSLGATIYHLLAGQTLFPLVSQRQIMDAILDEDPPPLVERRPDCPAPLAKLVHWLIEKDPDDRPPHAGFVADKLRALRGGTS